MGRRAATSLAVALASVVASTCTPKECDTDGVPRCDGNTLHAECAGGVDTAGPEDCGARTCIIDVAPNGHVYGLCSIDGRPDARCAGGIDFQSCDGDHVLTCRGRYRESEVDCAAAGLVCETARDVSGDAAAACVVAHAVDPGCPPDGRFRLLCIGDFVTRCFGRFDAPSVDCRATGTFCHADASYARCVADPNPDPRCADVAHFCDGPRGFYCFDGRQAGPAGDCTPQGKTCVATSDFFGCR